MERNEEIKLKGLVAGFIRYMVNVYAVPEDLAVLQGTNVFVFLNEYLPKIGHVVLKVGAENGNEDQRITQGVVEVRIDPGVFTDQSINAVPPPARPPRSKRRDPKGRKRQAD